MVWALVIACLLIAAGYAWSLRWRPAPPAPSVIVAAVGSASASRDVLLSQRLEAAMSQAVLDAMGEGVTDPDVIRARKLAARERVKAG